MKNACLSVVLFLLLAVVLAGATDAGNLVMRTVDGNVVIIHPDATEEQIFTVVHMQKVQGSEFWRVDANLLVMTIRTRVTTSQNRCTTPSVLTSKPLPVQGSKTKKEI